MTINPDPSPLSPTVDLPSAEVLLGKKVKHLRTERGLSLRTLAELSGLNINTLSLLENGRTSPSVSTLQQLARALDVQITAFFDTEPVEKQIVYTPASARPAERVGHVDMQNLGKGLMGSYVQPFLVILQPGMGSGEKSVEHTGHEFLFCLHGSIQCQVDGNEYVLVTGDSLLFQARLPHSWKNPSADTAQILLVLIPADFYEQPVNRHFTDQSNE